MVRYNPCTAFFLLLHFFDNCKYSATFWQKCRLKLRKESFLVIIFLSRFFYRKRSPVMKTKELLADSFRSLVLTMPFQKISIKMITDGAHVIRPTFYNYFQDKYEVIEFLFDQDIGSKVEVMIENDMEQEAIKLMFICFEKNKEYYHRLFETTGQNCFGEFFSHYCEQTFFRILSRHPMRKMPCELITPQSLAHYNALLLIEILKLWLSSPKEVPAEKIFEAYQYIIRTPILDMIQYPEPEKDRAN